ncbi:uncharacterized protein [Watersipora subatra]|uniref:uncharacterized protein n=1 Tax=Watersipora subatra TaxID=2589382 RepID=UPI00355B3D44
MVVTFDVSGDIVEVVVILDTDVLAVIIGWFAGRPLVDAILSKETFVPANKVVEDVVGGMCAESLFILVREVSAKFVLADINGCVAVVGVDVTDVDGYAGVTFVEVDGSVSSTLFKASVGATVVVEKDVDENGKSTILLVFVVDVGIAGLVVVVGLINVEVVLAEAGDHVIEVCFDDLVEVAVVVEFNVCVFVAMNVGFVADVVAVVDGLDAAVVEWDNGIEVEANVVVTEVYVDFVGAVGDLVEMNVDGVVEVDIVLVDMDVAVDVDVVVDVNVVFEVDVGFVVKIDFVVVEVDVGVLVEVDVDGVVEVDIVVVDMDIAVDLGVVVDVDVAVVELDLNFVVEVKYGVWIFFVIRANQGLTVTNQKSSLLCRAPKC